MRLDSYIDNSVVELTSSFNNAIVYATSLCNIDSIVEIVSSMFNISDIISELSIYSTQSAAVFGRIVFGQSAYGYLINYGSYTLTSRMDDE